MADPHNEEHSSLIKTPQQLIVVVVLSFLVPVLGIILIVSLVTGGMHVDSSSPAMSEDAVARRLKPVGEVVIGEPAPAAAGSAVTTTGDPARTAAVAAAAGPVDGKKTYETACAMCHAAGVAGAPKTGDKTAWKARIAQGKDTLYNSALKGKNLMPAKGGAATLSDAAVKAAVDYLVSQGK